MRKQVKTLMECVNQISFLGSVIHNYFQVIRKTLQDVIPKSIVCAMVEFVQVLFKVN